MCLCVCVKVAYVPYHITGIELCGIFSVSGGAGGTFFFVCVAFIPSCAAV